MVRRHGSQSPESFESTVGIFDAHVSLEQTTGSGPTWIRCQ